MPRQRSPNRDKAFEIYKEHGGNIDLIKIAEMVNLSPGTIRGWKNKDKWDDKLNGTFQKNMERSKRKNNNSDLKKESIVEEVKEVLENPELTDKQRLFCIYYSKRFNATKAYQKAYGCDYITANTNGPRLLVNACIKEEIQKLKQGKLNRAMLSPDDIFQKYMDIAFSNMTDYVSFGQKTMTIRDKKTGEPLLDNEGNKIEYQYSYVDFKESSEVDGSLISEVKQGKDGISIKLHDAMKALDWLSKHMDMATEEQRLRMEKLRTEIEKSKGDGKNDEAKTWADKIQEIASKRRGENG
jgi:phage terminase small subunit